MRPVYRTRTVFIPLTGGLKQGASIAFPDQQDLKNAIITSVETFTGDDLLTAPDGTPILTAGDALNVLVTIAQQSDQRIKQVPYQAMSAFRNAGEPRQYDALLVEWTQCRIELTANLAATTATAAVCVGYYYPTKDEATSQRAQAARGQRVKGKR